MTVYVVYFNWDNDEDYDCHDCGEKVKCICLTREKAMEIIANIEVPFGAIEGANEDFKEYFEDLGVIRVFHTKCRWSCPHEWYTIKEMELIE